MRAALVVLCGCVTIAACTTAPTTLSASATQNSHQPQQLIQQTSRINGPAGASPAPPRPSASLSPTPPIIITTQPTAAPQGDISIDFANTDIRTAIAQILGAILHQNYAIDPGVQGTVTLHTTTPLSRAALIPTLQNLLAQNNAMLIQTNGLYRVMPADQSAASPTITSDPTLGGAAFIALHYIQAPRLAQMLQPYITNTTRITIIPSQNALIISGDPGTRTALLNLIQTFDIDELAGQSYELFPVTAGDAQDFAAAFTTALNKSGDPSQHGPITVLPLERINGVLVITRTQNLLRDAQRVYAVLNQMERETLRSWHVYYMQNGQASTAGYLLQQAFTPDNVTGQSTPQTPSPTPNAGADSATATAPPPTTDTTDTSTTNTAASPLLGPLPATSTAGGMAMRIVVDNQNNSLLLYGTADEADEIDAMLAKIDIAPVEVRIDATIAEVDLNNALQYGTQFFFKSGDINAELSTATATVPNAGLATNFPGFVLSGAGSDAAPLAISALQSVTKVNVLSSPELMVLNGQPASLQVGDLVPYLSQTSQDTTTSNAPVIQSIDYRETGVILQVTPHVASNGLVTLDVAQEVSSVQPNLTTAGVNSPTFQERAVTSRVAIGDGETIGLAGLISDSDSHGNSGIPFLKNIPLLGALVSSQNNMRGREELLVLITPHVIRAQTDAAALTADLREQLPIAASVPGYLKAAEPGGSADPNQTLRDGAPAQFAN